MRYNLKSVLPQIHQVASPIRFIWQHRRSNPKRALDYRVLKGSSNVSFNSQGNPSRLNRIVGSEEKGNRHDIIPKEGSIFGASGDELGIRVDIRVLDDGPRI